MYFIEVESILIDNCTFSNNLVKNDLMTFRSVYTANLQRSLFSSNNASRHINYIDHESTFITNSTFQYNTGSESIFQLVSCANLTLSNVHILYSDGVEKNLYLENSVCTISNSSIQRAVGVEYGGAISSKNSDLIITNCYFR